MRSIFPSSYEVSRTLRDFDHRKDHLASEFANAKTVAEKNNLMLDNCRYAYFYTNPSPASMRKIGFRFREFYRIMGGDVPDHVQDCIIKDDSRYAPNFSSLTKDQQEHVAKTNPWVVYGWRHLFSDSLLKKVNPSYTKILSSLELLQIPKEQFNEMCLGLLNNKSMLDNASKAPPVDFEF